MKNIFSKFNVLFAVCICAALVLFGDTTVNAAISGFQMWLCCVMPSVFPFFVCTALLRESGLKNSSSRIALFAGCALSGAPAGSRLCSALMENGTIDKGTLSLYCAACNMASPAFLTGSLYVLAGTRAFGIPVIIGHYAAAATVFFFVSRKQRKTAKKEVFSGKSFAQALTSAIQEGFFSSLRVCGVIVFFTVIIAIIATLAGLVGIDIGSPLFIGLISCLEMTNGVALLVTLDASFPLICALVAFCISFGGLCIMLQTMSLCEINVKKYLVVKLITGVLSGVFAYIAASIIPQPQSVFAPIEEAAQKGVSLALCALSSLLGCAVIWLFAAGRQKRRL